MDQSTVRDLQLHLSKYLSKETTLRQFREWFDDATWGVAAESDSPLRRMAGEIELRLAEFTSGHLTESEMRKQLQPLLQPEPAAKR
jgi:elongation factor P--beta-lysine ligase